MAPLQALLALLGVAIGLLLGSVLPADILARRYSVDIRARGDGNPGTVNAVRVLGWAPGLLTAAYDFSVGIVAILIARLLGAPAGLTYLAGLATVVGHRFPVFRVFRGGGQGMAASAGLLIYGVVTAFQGGWLNAFDLVALLSVLAVTFALTRSDSVAAIVMLPLLVARLMWARTEWQLLALVGVVATYIWFVQVPPARRWMASRALGPARGRTHE